MMSRDLRNAADSLRAMLDEGLAPSPSDLATLCDLLDDSARHAAQTEALLRAAPATELVAFARLGAPPACR